MKRYLIFIIPLLVFTSCKKFLDVQPESDVTKEQLFTTEDGFEEALNGVYTRCTKADLYGGNLTFSNLDIMAQNYSFSNTDFQKIASFQYKQSILKDKNSQIWSAVYNAIGNCNEILQVIDKQKAVFSGNNYAIIKGEALALRAYLHFDLLRMFGASYKYNPNSKGIPYVTDVSIKSTPFSSVGDVINYAIIDLRNARTLLSNTDPIISAAYVVGYPNKTYSAGYTGLKQTETSSNTLFLQNRRHRLNYYAVCGELARVYLYKNDYQNALSNANDVISANKFPWTQKDDAFNNNVEQKDRIFYNELVFGWYAPHANDNSALVTLFSATNTAQYQPTPLQLNNIYEKSTVGAEDWRYRQWFFTATDVTPNRSYLVKYLVNSSPQVNLHPLMAPAFRLTEAYYIAAEASYDSNPTKAIEYLNTVRTHRGIIDLLPSTLGKTAFMNELVKEARKEFYGESQIFYMYKRLNLDIVAASGQIYPASNSIYVFPVPDDEAAYNN
jgi:hypothetical protein